MKFFLVLVVLVFIIYSCSDKLNSKKEGQQVNPREAQKSEYIEFDKQLFKMVFLQSCLKFSYNSSPCIKEILKEDKSRSDFKFGLENYRLIDSIALEVSNEIKLDSAKITEHYLKEGLDELAKLKSGKKVFLFCMEKFNSLHVDSLAEKVANEINN